MGEGPKIGEAHIDITADLSQLREDVGKINETMAGVKPGPGMGKIAGGAIIAGLALKALSGMFNLITGAIKAVVSLITGVLKVAFKILGAIIKGVMGIIGAAIKGVMSLVRKVVSFVKGSIGVTAEFGQSMARVMALTSGKADKAFTGMRKKALELGRTTEFTATQSAEAMGNFAMAGFSANEIMQAIGPTLDFASANMLDLGTASDIAARVMGAMQLSASETRRVMDALTVGATKTNQNVVDLGEAFKNAGSSANVANASFEMTTAALMAMADQGQRGSEAGSALKQVFLKLGTKNVAKLFKGLNIPLGDATGNFRQMPDLIDDMNKKFANVNEIQKLTMLIQAFGTRAGPGMVKLLNAGGDALRDYLKLINDNKDAAKKIATIQRDTLATSFKLVESAVEGLNIAVGNIFSPFIKEKNKRFAKFLEGVTNLVTKWTPTIQKKITEMLDWVKKNGKQLLTDIIAEVILFKDDLLDLFDSIKVTFSALTEGGKGVFTQIFGTDYMKDGSMVRNIAVMLISVFTELEGVFDRIWLLIQSLFEMFVRFGPMIGNFAASMGDLLNPFAGKKKKARAQENVDFFFSDTLPGMMTDVKTRLRRGEARLQSTTGTATPGGLRPLHERKMDRIAALDKARELRENVRAGTHDRQGNVILPEPAEPPTYEMVPGTQPALPRTYCGRRRHGSPVDLTPQLDKAC